MAGGRHHGEWVPGLLTEPLLAGESGPQRRARLEARRTDERRRSFTRPAKPGFCWVAVAVSGGAVERPGLVARWEHSPQAWSALVAWTGTDGEVRVEWIDAARLTPVIPQE